MLSPDRYTISLYDYICSTLLSAIGPLVPDYISALLPKIELRTGVLGAARVSIAGRDSSVAVKQSAIYTKITYPSYPGIPGHITAFGALLMSPIIRLFSVLHPSD